MASEHDGRPTCKLSAIDPGRYDDVDGDVRRRAEDLRWRMKELESDDAIAIARTEDGEVIHTHQRGAMYHSPQNRPNGDEHSRLYDECQYWARGSDFALDPKFHKNQIGDGPDRAMMPEVVLLVYDGDVVRWNLEGVFPCVYDESNAVIGPEDYLTTVEDGGSWRPTDPDLVDIAHEDKLDVITSYLMGHPEELGGRWIYAESDVDVGVEGTIDLVYEHEREDRYMIVAVKPNPNDREALDRAFGELLRYRRGFNESRPDATMDGIDLALAGPSFPDIYEWIVRDAAIELVTVDVS